MSVDLLEKLLHRFGDENHAEAYNAFQIFRQLCRSRSISTTGLHLVDEAPDGLSSANYGKSLADYEAKKYLATIAGLEAKNETLQGQVEQLNRILDQIFVLSNTALGEPEDEPEVEKPTKQPKTPKQPKRVSKGEHQEFNRPTVEMLEKMFGPKWATPARTYYHTCFGMVETTSMFTSWKTGYVPILEKYAQIIRDDFSYWTKHGKLP